jgi:hypothetical protein
MTYLVISTEAIGISDARHEHKREIPMESIRHFVEMYNPLPRKGCGSLFCTQEGDGRIEGKKTRRETRA